MPQCEDMPLGSEESIASVLFGTRRSYQQVSPSEQTILARKAGVLFKNWRGR